MGARQVATVQPAVALPQKQPACLTDATTGLVDCGDWAESASWAVPAGATSGIYFADLVRADTGGTSQIFFVVRDDAGASDILYQTSDTTWQAYNGYGGNSLYVGSPAGRAYKVSYNRPFTTAAGSGGGGGAEDFVFAAEYPMVRWLEGNGYNVSYSTGVDSDRNGALIKNHRVFLSSGHDEYWSGNQRASVAAALGAGVNLAFFSGNEVFWKTRWEASIDGSGTPYRTLVSYKETHANQPIDPLDPPTWTGTWRDPRFSPPADGGRPENGLTGTIFMVNGTDYRDLQVPWDDGRMRFWRNTAVASQASGQTRTITAGCDCLLGYEWDEDLDNGSRPPGLFHLSTSTYNVGSRLLDYGNSFGNGTATHHLTLYRSPSGALVFGAGTVGWAYGLDNGSYVVRSTPDPNIQQATVNLFADMHVQPATLQSGLSLATASTDTTPPSSKITSPSPGATVTSNSTIAVSGTAADAGGGVVGGVEVSVDGGATWHPASGRENWTYTWTPGTTGSTTGSVTIKSRAVDDSGNLETPTAGVTVNIGPALCPCSIWDNGAMPALADETDDPHAIEVGVKFYADASGFVSGIRFYKGSLNTGTHIGNLWTSTGQLLASATFTNETVSGWQEVSFASPVLISANTIYVASYHTNVGQYAADKAYFATSEWDNPPLHALAGGASGGDGVYAYGASSAFPAHTYNSENYWVDVVFTPAEAPAETPKCNGGHPCTPTPTATVGAPLSASPDEALVADSFLGP
jgi:hypothetical protein